LRTLWKHLDSPLRQHPDIVRTMQAGGNHACRGIFSQLLEPAPRGGTGMKNIVGLQLVPSPADNQPADAIAAYRPYTRALLRRYFRVAVDIGRLPSILGGLCFRARVSSYKLNTFEDAVIFVHDIERVFDRVARHYMEIIAGVILLDHSLPEAALHLGITVQRAERRYGAALDALSTVLLEVGLLRPIFGQGTTEDQDISSEVLAPRKPPVSVRLADQAPLHRQGSRTGLK